MEIKKIELQPQKIKYLNVYKKNIIKNNFKELQNIIFLKTPDHIIIEWDLLKTIVSFLEIVYYDKSKKYDVMYFTSSKIKKYYKELYFQDFNKIYSNNGLDVLFSCRSGVKYNKIDKLWVIDVKSFMKQLKIDYMNDVNIYGIDFDK